MNIEEVLVPAKLSFSSSQGKSGKCNTSGFSRYFAVLLRDTQSDASSTQPSWCVCWRERKTHQPSFKKLVFLTFCSIFFPPRCVNYLHKVFQGIEFALELYFPPKIQRTFAGKADLSAGSLTIQNQIIATIKDLNWVTPLLNFTVSSALMVTNDYGKTEIKRVK